MIRRAVPADHHALVDVWCRSVRATHDFLTEEDIAVYLPLVRDGTVRDLEVWVLVDAGGRLRGWIGLAGAKVEALFVAPEFHGRGGGRALIEHARAHHPVLTLDVNEQNLGARRFYDRLGFVEEGRSPRDAVGRPFPLLHLRSGREPDVDRPAVRPTRG